MRTENRGPCFNILFQLARKSSFFPEKNHVSLKYSPVSTVTALIAALLIALAARPAAVFALDLTNPVITDNQGDVLDGWTSSLTYDIDFSDTGGSQLDYFEIEVCSYFAKCNDVINWTTVASGIASDTYTTDWALPGAVWAAMPDDTDNYISVRVHDGATNLNEQGPLFYVYKDTAPPDQSSWLPANFSSIGTSTPTVTFTTEHLATCKWDLSNLGYAAMPPGNVCSGANTTSQSCNTSGLLEPQDFIYLSCTDPENHTGASAGKQLRYDIDLSPPSYISWVYDSLGADVDSTTSSTQLQANWEASTDAGSGLKYYLYAIGTTPGGTETRGWTAIGTTANYSAGSLSLTSGVTYYFSVKAQNNAGIRTAASTTDGILVDFLPPAQSNWSPATGTIFTSTPTITFNTDEIADCKWDTAFDYSYDNMGHDCTGDGTMNQSCAVTGLVEGPNTVYIACRDTLGNKDTPASNEELVYVYDTGPPIQSNWAPVNGSTITNATDTVIFTTNESAYCRWSLTDQSYDAMAGDCSGDGTKSQSCDVTGMSEGANTVYLACADEAGSKDTAGTNSELAYTLDTIPPVESNWNPADSSTLNTVSPVINFDTDEAANCKWSLTDINYTAMTNSCGGDTGTSHSCSVTGFSEGANSVHIACVDMNLNAETASTNTDLSYTVDDSEPVQSNWNPAKSSVIATTTPIITFDTDENADCKWALSDWAYVSMSNDCSGDGTASQTCPVTGLSEGAANVYISCQDTPGNKDTAVTNENISYTVDISVPVPSNFNPAGGSSFASGAVTINFNTNEIADCRWSLTDQAYSAMAGDCNGDGTTTPSCLVSGLSEGANSVHIACSDPYGNSDTSGTNEDLAYTSDTTPPTASAWNPANSATVTSSSPSVTFTTNENAGCRASLDGDESYDLMSDDFDCTGDGTKNQSCALSGLAESTNTVYFACIDSLGNADSAGTNDEITYYLDSTTPVQSNWSPADGSTFAATARVITFNTNENADCRASLDGDESYDLMSDDFDCTGDGTTSQSCSVSGLAEGANTVYIACTDTPGNKDNAASNSELGYTVDTTPPVQSAWAPANSSAFATTSVSVSFNTNENASCRASLDGDETYALMSDDFDCTGDGTTSQSCAVSGLAIGANSLYLACSDSLSNEDSAVTNTMLSYTVDLATPVQSNWSPANGATVITSAPTVTFNTDENADCRASLDGDETYALMSDDTDCTGDGTTSQSCAVTGLVEATNTVYLACNDSVGNSDSAASNSELTYYLDTTPPSQSNWSPAKDSIITTSTPTISFNTNENASCRASLDGDESYALMSDDTDCAGDGTTSQSCALSGLSEATNTIYIACADTPGNADSASTNEEINYILDTTLPTLTNFNPVIGETIINTAVVLGFDTDENATCRWALADLAYSAMADTCSGGGSAAHSCTVTGLIEGPEVIYISCADTAGNENTAANNRDLGYSVDISIPVLSNFNPPKGSYLSATSLTITFDTDEGATCRWDLTDNDYGLMPGGNNCGIITSNHSCNVSGLSNGAEIVYVACEDLGGNMASTADNEHLGYFVDTVAPNPVPWVYDGSGADVDTWSNGSQLDANWDTTSDTGSGVESYLYAVGSIPGATDTKNWTSAGASISVTISGIFMTSGQMYYVSVKARDYAGLLSDATTSDGVLVEYTDTDPPVQSNWSPATSTYINSETMTITFNTNESAWCRWSETQLGYAGMTNNCTGAGSTGFSCLATTTWPSSDIIFGPVYIACADTVGNEDTALSATRLEYPFDNTPPPAPAYVNDGDLGDIDVTNNSSMLEANWPPAASSYLNESPIMDQMIAAGTSPGATDTFNWISVSASMSATSVSPLSLTDGLTYYFSVKVRDTAGNVSAVTSSDGVLMDLMPPVQSNWNPAKDSTISTLSPAVTFDTDAAAWCRWSATDDGYSSMTSDCTGGGSTSQSCPVTGLSEGAVTIHIACMDEATNKDNNTSNEDISYTVITDSQPPVQSNWAPANSSTILTSSQDITFGTDEAADCKWALSDMAYSAMTDTCSASDTINQTCSITGLTDGAVTVYIACSDTSANEDSISTNTELSYTVDTSGGDTTPPVQSGWSPASGSTLNATSQAITFATDENAACRWSLTDQAYADMSGDCSGNGTTSQSCTATGMAESANTVYIACSDTSANEDSISTNTELSYTVDTSGGDTTPPVQSGWSPASGSLLTASSQSVMFTTDENADCRWSLTDQAYADMSGDCSGSGTTSQSCAVTGMAAGPNSVYLACSDTTGNSHTADTNTGLNYSVYIDNISLTARWNFVGVSKENVSLIPSASFGTTGNEVIRADGNNIEHYFFTAQSVFSPLFTRTYWIWSDDALGEIESGGTVYTQNSYNITLNSTSGWSSFSSPYNVELDWADSSASLDCGGPAALPAIYSWNGSGYNKTQPDNGEKLLPWIGYYMKTTGACTLTINK